MIPAALLLSLCLAEPTSEEAADLEEQRFVDDRPAVLQLQTGLDLGGRFGVSAGNVLAVPFIVPGPGAYASLDTRLLIYEVGFFDLEGGVSFGVNDQGDPTSIAGYKVRGGGGVRFQLIDEFRIDVDLHAGITSLALIPTPRAGLGIDAGLRLPIGEEATFDVDSGVDLDLLVIVPAPGGRAQVGLTWRPGPFQLGVYGGVDGDAVLAVLANTISASAYVTTRFAFVL